LKENQGDEDMFFDPFTWLNHSPGWLVNLGDVLPLAFTSTAAFKYLEVDDKYRAGKKEAVLFPHESLFLWIDEGTFTAVYWNWFHETFDLAISVNVAEAEKDYTPRQDLAQELSIYLLSFIRQAQQEFSLTSALSQLPPLSAEEIEKAERQLVVKPAGDPLTSDLGMGSARRSWQRLSRDFDVYVDARPEETATDRFANELAMTLHSNLDIPLERRHLRRVRFSAVHLDGFVNTIVFVAKHPRAKQKYAPLARAATKPVEIVIDRFGNSVSPLFKVNTRSGLNEFYGFHVFAKKEYLTTADDRKKPVAPLSIDFTKFGGELYEDIFVQNTIEPKIGPGEFPYFLYSFLPQSSPADRAEVYRQFSTAISRFEIDLGFEPGTVVQSFSLIPAAINENASILFANPGVIVAWDKIFPKVIGGNFEVLFHELMHTLDFKYEVSAADCFRTIYDQLIFTNDTDFFDAISDKNFLPGGFGGHPIDNRFEFFASLLNTFQHPDWQAAVTALDSRIRGIYYHSIACAYKLMKEKIPWFDGSRFSDKMRDGIDSLGKSEAIPELDQLYLSPLSLMMTERFPDIAIVHHSDFRPLVLKASQPVVLLVLDQRMGSLRDQIGKLKDFINNRARLMMMPYGEWEILDRQDPTIFGETELFSNMSTYLFQNGQLVFTHIPFMINPFIADDPSGLEELNKVLD
jgi:hypothetical protein